MVKLSPLVQSEVTRLQSRIQVAHRRIEQDKNADEEAEVIDRLEPIVEEMKKTNQLQEFVPRPAPKPKPAPKQQQKKAVVEEKKPSKPNKAPHASNK